MPRLIYILLVVFLISWLFVSDSYAQDPDLPGNFALGNCSDNLCNFTYSGEPGWPTTLTGYLYLPPSSGPHPAIVISHGKGGGGAGFCVLGRDWLPNFAAICPNYTHAGGGLGGGGADGGSPENVQRATRALDILVSNQFTQKTGKTVDPRRLYLYGNSMGGFVTIETASIIGARIAAAAYTASGLMDPYTPSGPAQAQFIQAPFLLLHGNKDGTVSPQASQDFADALGSYGKMYSLVWFPNGEHNLIYDPAINAQVFQLINSWFSGTIAPSPTFGPSPTPPPPSTTQPPPPGDQDGDGDRDIYDYYRLLIQFPAKTVLNFNLLVRYF